MLKEELTGSIFSILLPAGDLIGSALARAPELMNVPPRVQLYFPLTPQPSFPLHISLLALIPAGEILISLFPGTTLQNLSGKHQGRTRGKPQEGMTGKPKGCLNEPLKLTKRWRVFQLWSWVSLPSAKEGRK